MGKQRTMTDLIALLIEEVKKQVAPERIDLMSKFFTLYYRHASMEDLMTRSIEDLYGGALSHFELQEVRKPGELKLRIFNPHFEQSGWQSTHTIIQIVTDDMPFLVDSLRMEINQLHLTMHLSIHMGGIGASRDGAGRLLDLSSHQDADKKHSIPEALIHMEIDRQTDQTFLEELQKNIERVLLDVRLAVTDWGAMQDRVREAILELDEKRMTQDENEVIETKSFLNWLLDNHFTFLGYREYEVTGRGDEQALKLVGGSSLGVLRDDTKSRVYRHYSELPKEARLQALSKEQILMSYKTNTPSTVHRPAYTDCIAVKRFDDKGNVIGERRFVGLYTSEAYRVDPRHIPFLCHKVISILKRSGLPENSHGAKDLLHILATLPRDDVFHGTTDELYDIAMGILHLQERRKTRLFIRKDAYSRFYSCLLYVPRENFNTELVSKAERILQDAFHALDITYSTYVSESILARIHYVVRVKPTVSAKLNFQELEKRLIEISESWQDGFRQSVLDYFGEERGSMLVNRYITAFPAGYREAFLPRQAVFDIEHMEKLCLGNELEMSFYRPLGEAREIIKFKLYHLNETVPLSDALPMLENMGLRVVGEQPYQINLRDGSFVWINDFRMEYPKDLAFEVEDVKDIFQETFRNVWNGFAENDKFNRLVLEAELNWREIVILRAYTKYARQIGFNFSETYITDTLIKNFSIAKLLIEIFKVMFDPSSSIAKEERLKELEHLVEKELESVSVLDEDRILRRFLFLIKATLRTNYFQQQEDGGFKAYFSIKLDSSRIPDMPLPLPKSEIFVYSPRFEGIHLRASKVARGGIRWSDRREDFRTEVLGLMKAQQVKNAMIVPAGAKGGFVTKRLPESGDRDAVMKEGIACYQNYIRGILDLADNIVNNEIVSPVDSVCYDDQDPYIVVAADKGTATFSDIANQIAAERNFWLGDAFASGGSRGYDHKKMGITTRGAWVSVERHFQDLGVNVDETEITVIGIGDMSGDVFGNGMLMSPLIKLVAAFNHTHIFLDPNPDPKATYEERKRLFNLPRSTWDDYDRSLLSPGGGIYPRSAKSIWISQEMKEVLKVDKDRFEPSELIRTLLKAPVDLLLNGGIGTYVKASSESNLDVGDRSNDVLRINGNELRARVICEGGNLGLTQLARIEYEQNGGRTNPDFIDNSGGVNCSDHEVNIKILLNKVVENGDLTEKQRNQLLVDMTAEVAELVLQENYRQNVSLSVASFDSARHIGLYMRYISDKEKTQQINRQLEFLPDDKTLMERRNQGKGMMRAELAILSAYSKIILKQEIKNTDLISDPYLSQVMARAFPMQLRKAYGDLMSSHYLANEIIATELSNLMVSQMGITFVYRMQDETGASLSLIMRAYATVEKIFDLESMNADIEALDYLVPVSVQYPLMLGVRRLIRRAIRWVIRNYRRRLDIAKAIEEFESPVQGIAEKLPELLLGDDKLAWDQTCDDLQQKGVPQDLAVRIAGLEALSHALNIAEAASSHQLEVLEVAKTYFMLLDRLNLTWFRDQINEHPVANRWMVLAKTAYKADLDWVHQELTVSILLNSKASDVSEKMDEWFAANEELLQRWRAIIAEMRRAEHKEFAIMSVAIRELMELARVNRGEGAGALEKSESVKGETHVDTGDRFDGL